MANLTVSTVVDNLMQATTAAGMRTILVLGNVENTALSTWTGSANITALGTIVTGIWHGTAITDTYISSAATWNAKQSALPTQTGHAGEFLFTDGSALSWAAAGIIDIERTVWLSPSGDDGTGAPGSPATAYATVQAAADAIAALSPAVDSSHPAALMIGPGVFGDSTTAWPAQGFAIQGAGCGVSQLGQTVLAPNVDTSLAAAGVSFGAGTTNSFVTSGTSNNQAFVLEGPCEVESCIYLPGNLTHRDGWGVTLKSGAYISVPNLLTDDVVNVDGLDAPGMMEAAGNAGYLLVSIGSYISGGNLQASGGDGDADVAAGNGGSVTINYGGAIAVSALNLSAGANGGGGTGTHGSASGSVGVLSYTSLSAGALVLGPIWVNGVLRGDTMTYAPSLATVGTITAGTWSATAIAANKGGTGQTSYAVGDLLYASTTSALSKLADVATGSVLVSGGISTAPAWSAAPTFAGTNLTGTASSLTAGNINSSSNTTLTSLANLVTVGTLTGGATGAGFTLALSTSTVTGTLAAARLPSSGVHSGDATGTFPTVTLNAAQAGITSVGTLTGGATGAGFTIALTTSTVTGNLPDARNTVSNSTTTTMGALATISGAGSITGAASTSITITGGSSGASCVVGQGANGGVTITTVGTGDMSAGNGNLLVGTTLPNRHTVTSGFKAVWIAANCSFMASTASTFEGITLNANIVRSQSVGDWACQDTSRPGWQTFIGYGSGADYFAIARAPATSSNAVFVNIFKATSTGVIVVGTSNISGAATFQSTIAVTGASTLTGGIVGTTAAGNATAGNLGEYSSSLIAVGSAVSLTTATAANVTSISLTAGDWDVTGTVNFTETVATASARTAGVNTTSATLPTDGSEANCGVQSTLTSETNSIPLTRKRVNVSSTTTVYLCASATFSAGTVGAYGNLTARRIR